MMYDSNNIFAKIIRRELESKKLYEDEKMVVIPDKFPDKNCKTHLLIMPKGEFVDFSDFVSKTDDSNLGTFVKNIDKIAKNLGLNSYQLLTNNGKSAGQEIMHFHLHLKSQDCVNSGI